MFCQLHIRIYVIVLIGLIFTACDDESKAEKEIANIEADFMIERFDTVFFNSTSEDLPKLKLKYPFFFSKRVSDSVWVHRMNDTLQNELLTEVNNTFPDTENIKGDIKSLFQHLKYYDKTFTIPRVITLTNDVDYRNKTIITDSLVLIALDNFLGPNHVFYQNIPKYLTANMNDNQIALNLADAYGAQYIFQSRRKSLLDEMIYFGKLLYFKDILTPFKTDAEKMGYSQEQLEWSKANESQIWSFFIEKELLYSTDNKLPGRFIVDAPFSKFYLELDNDSPGRLGQYIGWQIVRAYAKTTGEDVMTILQKEPEEIFRKSKFKPKK